LPVLVYEALTYDYQYANDRLHTFVLQAVPETAARLKKAGIGYVFYLRRNRQSSNNNFYLLADKAAAVVTDDYPVFIAAEHNRSVAPKLKVPYYVVDASCVVPTVKIEKRQFAAYTIRPRIHRLLPQYLKEPDALQVKVPYKLPIPAWHVAVEPGKIAELVASCDIDHTIAPSLTFDGGRVAAEKLLDFFLEKNLGRFAQDRNDPVRHATSHMSPYLHFGQISSLEIALAVGKRAAKQKLDAGSYLEELIVRRELSFNYARFVERPNRLENLPEWAQATMAKHARDERSPKFNAKQIEQGETYDELWNATQKEMLLRGKIQGYYRMYWGKKILEWMQSYQAAADLMIDLHGKYSLDGRDPNTYTNVLWCFGLHDRAWGERPIFGKIRYMSGDSTRRKTNAAAYIEEIRQMEKTGKDPAKMVVT
jgi:deoxyribodipyrimidine photo-lyase